jgi:hypothetical protein
LVRWRAACRVACRALRLVTNTSISALRFVAVIDLTRPFGVIPRVAFLHFSPRACQGRV